MNLLGLSTTRVNRALSRFTLGNWAANQFLDLADPSGLRNHNQLAYWWDARFGVSATLGRSYKSNSWHAINDPTCYWHCLKTNNLPTGGYLRKPPGFGYPSHFPTSYFAPWLQGDLLTLGPSTVDSGGGSDIYGIAALDDWTVLILVYIKDYTGTGQRDIIRYTPRLQYYATSKTFSINNGGFVKAPNNSVTGNGWYYVLWEKNGTDAAVSVNGGTEGTGTVDDVSLGAGADYVGTEGRLAPAQIWMMDGVLSSGDKTSFYNHFEGLIE